MSADATTLLQGFGLLLQSLLEAEADFLCGAELYERSSQRVNYRSGFYRRKVSTHLGDVPLRVAHLKYMHPRVSMMKRARRLEFTIIQSLAQIHEVGAAPEHVALLIKNLWTVELPEAHLAQLAQQLTATLELWRAPTTPQSGSDLQPSPESAATALANFTNTSDTSAADPISAVI